MTAPSTPPSPALSLEDVTKTFGPKKAVDALSLAVSPGTVVGLIGPNGAGKTTTIRLLLGILRPDQGQVRVLGRPVGGARAEVGYLPEERGVYRRMRGRAFIAYLASLRGVAEGPALAHARSILSLLDLPDVLDKRLEEMSKGMQQKVQIAAALAHDPAVVILDEPWSGLDPVASRGLGEVVRGLRERGRAVLVSTHLMPQAEALCDRAVMIYGGKKVLDRDLRGSDGPDRMLAVERLDGQFDDGTIAALPGVESVTGKAPSMRVALREGVEASEVLAAIAARVPVRSIAMVRPTLEETFVALVGASGSAGDP